MDSDNLKSLWYTRTMKWSKLIDKISQVDDTIVIDLEKDEEAAYDEIDEVEEFSRSFEAEEVDSDDVDVKEDIKFKTMIEKENENGTEDYKDLEKTLITDETVRSLFEETLPRIKQQNLKSTLAKYEELFNTFDSELIQREFKRMQCTHGHSDVLKNNNCQRRLLGKFNDNRLYSPSESEAIHGQEIVLEMPHPFYRWPEVDTNFITIPMLSKSLLRSKTLTCDCLKVKGESVLFREPSNGSDTNHHRSNYYEVLCTPYDVHRIYRHNHVYKKHQKSCDECPNCGDDKSFEGNKTCLSRFQMTPLPFESHKSGIESDRISNCRRILVLRDQFNTNHSRTTCLNDRHRKSHRPEQIAYRNIRDQQTPDSVIKKNQLNQAEIKERESDDERVRELSEVMSEKCVLRARVHASKENFSPEEKQKPQLSPIDSDKCQLRSEKSVCGRKEALLSKQGDKKKEKTRKGIPKKKAISKQCDSQKKTVKANEKLSQKSETDGKPEVNSKKKNKLRKTSQKFIETELSESSVEEGSFIGLEQAIAESKRIYETEQIRLREENDHKMKHSSESKSTHNPSAIPSSSKMLKLKTAKSSKGMVLKKIGENAEPNCLATPTHDVDNHVNVVDDGQDVNKVINSSCVIEEEPVKLKRTQKSKGLKNDKEERRRNQQKQKKINDDKGTYEREITSNDEKLENGETSESKMVLSKGRKEILKSQNLFHMKSAPQKDQQQVVKISEKSRQTEDAKGSIARAEENEEKKVSAEKFIAPRLKGSVAASSLFKAECEERTLYNPDGPICNSTALQNDTAAAKQLLIPNVRKQVKGTSRHPKTHEPLAISGQSKPKVKWSQPQRRSAVVTDIDTDTDDDDCFVVSSTTCENVEKSTKKQTNNQSKYVNEEMNNDDEDDCIILYSPNNPELTPSSSFVNGYFKLTEEYLAQIIGDYQARRFMTFYLGDREFDLSSTVYYKPPNAAELSESDEEDEIFEKFGRYGSIIEK